MASTDPTGLPGGCCIVCFGREMCGIIVIGGRGESGAVPDGKETYNLQCLSVQIELIGGFYRKKEDRRDDVAQERLLRPRAEWNTVIVA